MGGGVLRKYSYRTIIWMVTVGPLESIIKDSKINTKQVMINGRGFNLATNYECCTGCAII